MSETHDKRRRTDLDLFVLALIDSGVATPYELRQNAGLSPGATIPALERLLQAGMVRQGKPGTRGRVKYLITRVGMTTMANGWRGLLEQGPSGDLDADLRVALLALWVGNERKGAMKFLRQAANRRLESIEAKEGNHKAKAPASLAEWYQQLRSASTTALLNGEAKAALAMAKALPRTHKKKRNLKQQT